MEECVVTVAKALCALKYPKADKVWLDTAHPNVGLLDPPWMYFQDDAKALVELWWKFKGQFTQ